jgi:hypothetical protein
MIRYLRRSEKRKTRRDDEARDKVASAGDKIFLSELYTVDRAGHVKDKSSSMMLLRAPLSISY